jgi:NAD(P)H-quinone oxidoreductase subunit 5
VRFGPVVTVDPTLLLLVVVVGAASALGGKLAKSVQSDVKRQLGCSTVGQMGFMIMQVGLGFFGAAITHLILHGFYKAYLFLSSGEQVSRTAPAASRSGSETPGLVGTAVVLSTALVGGALFAILTGKGTSLDSGVLLALLVVLMTLQAARTVVGRTALPATVRYGAVPLVFLPAIAVYAAVYTAVTRLLADLAIVTAPLPLSVPVGVVVAAFVVTYVVTETGRYQHSQRLYVALLNATQPPKRTLLTKTEEYNEY